uniref:LamG-like jellyroll fold domain-containing protein n=1 Tax=Flammeovirga sp. OC4 TaxID=1382345 RepID=UPI0005C7A0F8
VTSTHQLTITPYIPEEEPLLDFAFSENVYDPAFINTGVRSEVSLSANESGGAEIALGVFDEDKGQVLGVSMEQGTGSLIFKENGGNYSGVTGTAARTYSAWIKPNDLSEFNTIFYAGIDEGEKTSLSVQVLPTGAIKLVAGGNIVTSEAYHFIENQWNHIVVSIPNESMLSDIQLYINGTLAETVVTNDRLFNTAPATLAIANKFWGLFSDFKYYERAISDEEAMDLYASTVFMHRINFNLPTTLAVRESVEFLISTTSNLDFEYSISDPSKIKIEEGKLIALEEGEVIIEATSFGVTSTHQLTITPYIPEEEPLLDFAFSENVYDPAFINTGVRSEVSLSANESGGAEIALGVFDEDKGQVLGVSMEQGTGSLIFKENGGNYSGVTGTAARTYSAWIKPNDLSEFNTIFYAGIDEGEKTSLSVQVLSTGAIKLVAGGNIVTTEAYHFIENQWNHIVVSIPNEAMLSDIQLYINGTLAETVVTNDRLFNTAPATLAIANKFWGLFSDFKYYERAISDEEAMDLYASTVFMHRIVFEMPSEINVGESIDINVSTSSNLPVDYSIDNEEVAFLLEGQLTGMMEGEVIITASSFGVVEEKVILVKEAIKEIAPAEEPILWFAFDEAQGENTFTNQGMLKEVSLEVEVEEEAVVLIGATDEERENVLFTDIPNQSGRLMFKEGNTNFPGVVGTAARTYSMWIKPTDLTEQKTLLYQGITIEKEEATNISLQVLPSGQVRFVAGGNITTSLHDQIQENQWNLLQVVIEENSSLEDVKIYINTNLATTTLSGNNNIVNTGAATFSLANKYTGYYSDFRLYNRALDDEEIKSFIPKQEQWITFQPIEDKTYGEPEFRLEATSTSGLEVSFKSSDEGIIQIDGSIAKIVGYGKVSITATQWGDLNYNPAEPVSMHFIVDIGKYKEKPELQVNYRFDEPTDLPGDPYDYSDYHRTAIMKGSYTKGYVDQERGEVMNFKVGTLEIEDYEGVLGSQKRSMATWFKANETKQSILTSYGEAGTGQFNIVYRANNKIRVSLFYNSYEDADGSPVYESSYVETEKAFDFISEWHHVAVVTEGETLNDIKIYIDGKPENVIISPWEGFEKVNTVKGANFKVALNSDLKMSDYRWFKGALNAQEVKDIFEGNKNVEEEIVVEDRVMTGGFGTAFIEMSDFFPVENQSVIYNVTSSNINVVKAQVEGSILLLNEVGNGVSEITVEVYSSEYELLGTQKFKVTVSGSSEELPNDTFTFRELPEFFRKKRNKPLLSFSTVTTIDVADFGAQADDDRNDFEAINEALKTAVAVASADNPVRVKFGKGTYDLLPENEEAVHLFNLSDLSHIILDGTGTNINILSPTVGFLALKNAQNVVVQGFDVDYEILPFVQGKVITIADDYIEMEVDKGFPSLMEYFMKTANQSWGYIRNEEGFLKEGVENLIKTDPNGWNALGNSVYSIRMSSSQIDNFEIGDYFIQMARNNGRTITKTTECKDVTFLNMTTYASPAGAYSMSKNEEVNLINCQVLLKEGRVHSTNADVIHVVGNKIGPWVQGCVFEGYADDAVNMKHGQANILEVLSPIELKVNSQFEIGNHLVAFNPREGKVMERVTVLSVIDNDDGTYNITLSNPISVQKTGTHQSADHLYNEDFATESFVFRDNIFRNARRYGMLIQSAFGVVENNIFEDLSTGGIVMENAVDWGEGFLAHNILIQQNTFANCGFDQTFIEDDYAATIKMLVMKLANENCNENDEWCGTSPAVCDAQGLKNIWLKQNTIHYNKVGILANCVEEGSIIDNQIIHNEDDPTLKEGEKGEAMNILQSTFDFDEILSIDNEFLHSDWEVTISKEGLHIRYKGTTLPIATLTLYDAMARKLLTANINQHQSTISTSTYKNQLYIIRIVDQNGNVFTSKLMYL